MARGEGAGRRSYTRAEMARSLGVTETEVEAMSLVGADFLGPLALPVHVVEPAQRRWEIGRLIAEDVVRLQGEQDEVQALLRAYEERWERAGPIDRAGLEATEGEAAAARAAAFRERVARWEAAARELCRVHGLGAPPAARRPDA